MIVVQAVLFGFQLDLAISRDWMVDIQRWHSACDEFLSKLWENWCGFGGCILDNFAGFWWVFGRWWLFWLFPTGTEEPSRNVGRFRNCGDTGDYPCCWFPAWAMLMSRHIFKAGEYPLVRSRWPGVSDDPITHFSDFLAICMSFSVSTQVLSRSNWLTLVWRRWIASAKRRPKTDENWPGKTDGFCSAAGSREAIVPGGLP